MCVEPELTTQSARLSTADADPRWGLKGLRIIQVAHHIIRQLHSRASQMAYSGWRFPFSSPVIWSPSTCRLLSLYNRFHHRASLGFDVFATGKVANTAIVSKVLLVSPCLVSVFNGTSRIFSTRLKHRCPFFLPLEAPLHLKCNTWSPKMSKGQIYKDKKQVNFPSPPLSWQTEQSRTLSVVNPSKNFLFCN